MRERRKEFLKKGGLVLQGLAVFLIYFGVLGVLMYPVLDAAKLIA